MTWSMFLPKLVLVNIILLSMSLTQMEVAKVQVEGDEEHKSLKKRPASQSLSDDEGVPGVSQLVNFSEDDLSGSSYSAL